jgi:hypothetical protein
MQRLTRIAMLLSVLGLSWTLAAEGLGAPRSVLVLDVPVASPGRLGDTHSEVPRPLAPMPACAACRLATQTTGQLAPDAVQLTTLVLQNGVALKAIAKDASARELLWKATLARGELLSALRNRVPIELCRACRESLDRMAELRIDARRTAQGIDLVYTSSDVRVVHDLHLVAREFERIHSF